MKTKFEKLRVVILKYDFMEVLSENFELNFTFPEHHPGMITSKTYFYERIKTRIGNMIKKRDRCGLSKASIKDVRESGEVRA
ncbi:hypothetical protein FIU87_03400 [Bacillus sp. THAF10]|uniref:hypothetical protein n=1 Tax=Bacillus sp. THAF10 TaxID=2587848 RepID=UPI001267ECF2|nr:hypothetical protein [Bacillus sp. THAF10]QFT87688.1 hypothetical protein FIU87_03400 [Bacillus sp. THAF10]